MWKSPKCQSVFCSRGDAPPSSSTRSEDWSEEHWAGAPVQEGMFWSESFPRWFTGRPLAPLLPTIRCAAPVTPLGKAQLPGEASLPENTPSCYLTAAIWTELSTSWGRRCTHRGQEMLDGRLTESFSLSGPKRQLTTATTTWFNNGQRTRSEEDTQTANKLVERCSASLVFR